MVRTQISLSDEQHRAAIALAEREGVSMAEIIRRGLDRVLAEADRRAKVDRALVAIHGLRTGSGYNDIAENHDQYLAEDFLA